MTVRGAASSCVTPVPDGLSFFKDAESVFFARAEVRLEDPYVFRADEIIRGTMKLGEVVSVQRRECLFVRTGERYLVVRLKCDPPQECVQFTDESHVPALLHYLANAHPENHEAVMVMFLRWYREEISPVDFGEWIDTLTVRPRSEEDDEFVHWLVSELSDIAANLRLFADHLEGTDAFARPLLQDVARVMEKFPPGSAGEFDARAEQAGEDAPRRDELEDELMDVIRRGCQSAEWQEALEIAWRKKDVTTQ